jgi:hypothetical protein
MGPALSDWLLCRRCSILGKGGSFLGFLKGPFRSRYPDTLGAARCHFSSHVMKGMCVVTAECDPTLWRSASGYGEAALIVDGWRYRA